MLNTGNNEESSRLVRYTGIVEKLKNNLCVGGCVGKSLMAEATYFISLSQ